jgi:Mrp family chromosome partitioning ATPase/predicted Fe-Mo cluster-binding NifX family protein
MHSCEHPEIEELVLRDRLSQIKNKIVVLSGKGGVGKSTVATNIAVSFALQGYKTGLLDVDVHGPSIPTLLGIEGKKLQSNEGTVLPLIYGDNLKVVSIGLVSEHSDNPVIWRGPAKYGFIKQMMAQVGWGELDYLIVDCPPGTGDEPLAVIQLLDNVTGAVIVTTPQKIAITAVRKSVNFCKQLNVPIIGVVENMSGDVFKSGGGEEMASNMDIPFLGRIPIDLKIVDTGDAGTPFIYYYGKTETAKMIEGIILLIKEFCMKKEEKTKNTKIAIPTANGKLCQHFGHCEAFTFIEVDESTKTIINKESIKGPEHEPGVIPPWVAKQGANVILTGGMGSRAQALFSEQGVKVISGVPSEDIEKVVMDYLNGTLVTGVSTCDH